MNRDRWITNVYKRADGRYYVNALDVQIVRTHYFFIQPNGMVCVPAPRLDEPGKYQAKKTLPPSIVSAVKSYLTEVEENAGQIPMNF